MYTDLSTDKANNVYSAYYIPKIHHYVPSKNQQKPKKCSHKFCRAHLALRGVIVSGIRWLTYVCWSCSITSNFSVISVTKSIFNHIWRAKANIWLLFHISIRVLLKLWTQACLTQHSYIVCNCQHFTKTKAQNRTYIFKQLILTWHCRCHSWMNE